MFKKSGPADGRYQHDNDWFCSDESCNNINFQSRNECDKCGKKRYQFDSNKRSKRLLGHEIGKQAAEKSRGIFSADDWQCGKCGNVNWSRRAKCNMCNAPKFCDNEERTGLGGGYNDRDKVEYIRRDDDSDSEYDDFGRKKKKFRSHKTLAESRSNTTSDTHDKRSTSSHNSYQKLDRDNETEKTKHDDDSSKIDSNSRNFRNDDSRKDYSRKYRNYDEDDDDEEDDDSDVDLSKYDVSDITKD